MNETKYYLVAHSALIDIEAFATPESALAIRNDLAALSANMPGDDRPAAAYVARINKNSPGPLSADSAAALAGDAPGDVVDIIQSTSPEDGVTAYLVPRAERLLSAEDAAGNNMTLDEFKEFSSALDQIFEPAERAKSPAAARYIELGEAETNEDEGHSEAFRELVRSLLTQTGVTNLTVIAWTVR